MLITIFILSGLTQPVQGSILHKTSMILRRYDYFLYSYSKKRQIHTCILADFDPEDFVFTAVSHQWCDLFYRLLHSSTRHIEEVEGGERDTLIVHRNEATVAWPEAIACHRPRRQSGVIKARPPPLHSTFPWTKISDFQEKRLKSMTASF